MEDSKNLPDFRVNFEPFFTPLNFRMKQGWLQSGRLDCSEVGIVEILPSVWIKIWSKRLRRYTGGAVEVAEVNFDARPFLLLFGDGPDCGRARTSAG